MPSFVANSLLRAVYKIVPPKSIMSETLLKFIQIMSEVNNPLKPRRTPKISKPLSTPTRTTALIAAFIPGASPPLVKTPIFLLPRIKVPPYIMQFNLL